MIYWLSCTNHLFPLSINPVIFGDWLSWVFFKGISLVPTYLHLVLLYGNCVIVPEARLYGASFALPILLDLCYIVLFLSECSSVVSGFTTNMWRNMVLVGYWLPYSAIHCCIFYSVLLKELFNMTLLTIWSLGQSPYCHPITIIHKVTHLLVLYLS